MGSGNLTTLIIDGEWLIPEINRSFLHANVDVFRIEVDEPSLEEIFIKIGGNQLGLIGLCHICMTREKTKMKELIAYRFNSLLMHRLSLFMNAYIRISMF